MSIGLITEVACPAAAGGGRASPSSGLLSRVSRMRFDDEAGRREPTVLSSASLRLRIFAVGPDVPEQLVRAGHLRRDARIGGP